MGSLIPLEGRAACISRNPSCRAAGWIAQRKAGLDGARPSCSTWTGRWWTACISYLSRWQVPWAIATSGRLESARPTLELLGVGPDVPVITRDQVQHAKPEPDLFLAAAERLGVPITTAIVVGDSVWDLLAARRARALGVGLLSGGYGQEELERAGAYRVYEDPADLLRHLDEVGVRTAE